MPLPRAAWIGGITLLLALIYLGLFSTLGDRQIGLSIGVTVDKTNQMRVYWTVPGDKFGEDRKSIVPLKAGSGRYNLSINPRSRPFHFQFNSGVGIQGLVIHDIVVQRIGRKALRYSADDLAQRLLVLDMASDWSLKESALHFPDSDRRISFRFDNLDAGGRAGRLLIAASALGGIAFTLFVFLLLTRIDSSRGYWLRYIAVACTIPWWLSALEAHTTFSIFIWLKSVSGTLFTACLILILLRSNLTAFRSLSNVPLSPRLLLPLILVAAVFWIGINQIPQIYGYWSQQENLLVGFAAQRTHFESTYRENFRYRKNFIELNSEIKVTGLSTSPTHKIIVGRDGFMFEGRGHRRVVDDDVQMFDNISDYMGQHGLSDAELRQWAQVLQQRKSWLEAQDMPYLFVMAPTKDMIYEDMLPDRLLRHSGATRRFDQLIDYLTQHTDIAVLDLRPVLQKARAEHQYPEIYYRSDFHWNFFGAFFAYEAVIKAANAHFPKLNLKPLKLDDFAVDATPDWVHHRFMNTLGLDPERHRYEHYIRMQPHDRSRFPAQLLPETGVQDVHWGKSIEGKRPQTRDLNLIENTHGELDTLLILGDSFIEKTMLYFSVHAKKTLYQRAVLDFPLNAFREHKPQLVVQEILNMYLLRRPPTNPKRVR